jgi:hypothetical protein
VGFGSRTQEVRQLDVSRIAVDLDPRVQNTEAAAHGESCRTRTEPRFGGSLQPDSNSLDARVRSSGGGIGVGYDWVLNPNENAVDAHRYV